MAVLTVIEPGLTGVSSATKVLAEVSLNVTESKLKRGVGRADGALEGVMLPSGTWWRTRGPVVELERGLEMSELELFARLFHGGNA